MLSALTVKPSVIVVRLSTSSVPLIVRLSSTIVSPVAESIVRLPVDVLISDVPSTPILMFLAVICSDE